MKMLKALNIYVKMYLFLSRNVATYFSSNVFHHQHFLLLDTQSALLQLVWMLIFVHSLLHASLVTGALVKSWKKLPTLALLHV